MDTVEWIILVTDHYDESRKYYHDVLELPIEREAPEEEFTQFRLKHCLLAIYGRNAVETLVGKEYLGKAGGAIYAFAEVDNVDTTYTSLMKKGVHFIQPPKTHAWGQRTAYFTDPDGHIWEIQQWIEKPSLWYDEVNI